MSNQVFGLILCGIGAVVGYRGYMNYQGHCWEERRYLTKQEKIHRAIEDVLRRYPPGVIPTVRLEENGRLVEKIISIDDFRNKVLDGRSYTMPKTPVFYSSVDDFLQKNPNCCELRGDRNFFNKSEFGGPSFFDLVTGGVSSYIRIRYWVKYMEGGEEKRIMNNYFADLSNCGNPARHSDVPSYMEYSIGH